MDYSKMLLITFCVFSFLHIVSVYLAIPHFVLLYLPHIVITEQQMEEYQ